MEHLSAEHTGRFAPVKRVIALVLVPAGAAIVAALAIARLTDTSASDMLRDPSAVLDGPWYIGLFSMTGVALWAAAAAVCLVALSARPAPGPRLLLIAGGVISLVLGADDLYLVHETVKNDLGIPSPVTMGLYAVVAGVLLYRARRYLMSRADVGVFVLAVGLFAVSVALDVGGEAGLPTPPLSAIIEDVAKFTGIAVWLAFFAGVARDLIRAPGQTAQALGRHLGTARVPVDDEAGI